VLGAHGAVTLTVCTLAASSACAVAVAPRSQVHLGPTTVG
jgi:hypothetical protein